jgi:hypothetical protein
MCNKLTDGHPTTLQSSARPITANPDKIVRTDVRIPDANVYVYDDFSGYGVWECLKDTVC